MNSQINISISNDQVICRLEIIPVWGLQILEEVRSPKFGYKNNPINSLKIFFQTRMPHFLLEDENADDTYGCSKFKAMGLRIPPALIDTKSSNFRMWLHDLLQNVYYVLYHR